MLPTALTSSYVANAFVLDMFSRGTFGHWLRVKSFLSHKTEIYHTDSVSESFQATTSNDEDTMPFHLPLFLLPLQ